MLTHVAWALLLLPGLWVVRRHAPALAAAGPMAQIALGYLATFCLIAPLSMAGYALHLPVAAVGVALGILVAAGAVLLWRDRSRGPSSGAAAAELVGGACLLLLLVMHARVGGWLDGDATYHVARIRDVLDNGLSNRNVLVRPERFDPTYHTNLLHSIHASIAWATAQSPIDVWFHSQVWATLLAGAGHYLMGYVMTGRRIGAWILCLVVLCARASVTYTLYPNALSIGWLLPTLSALVILAAGIGGFADLTAAPSRPPVTRGALAGLAASALVLGQVHALYAAYALALWVPVLLLTAALGGVNRRRPALQSLGALALSVPLIVVAADRSPLEVDAGDLVVEGIEEGDLSASMLSAWGVPPTRAAWQHRSPDTAKTAALRAGGGHLEKRLEKLADGSQVLRPRHMGGVAWLCAGFAALLVVFWRDRSRRRVWGVASAMATALALMLLVPALCTLAVSVAPSAFVVARLATWLSTLLMCGLAGVATLVSIGIATRFGSAAQAALLPVLCLGALLLPGHAPRGIAEHAERVRAPATERHATRLLLHERTSFLRKHLPAGQPVLADLQLARHITMLHDVTVIAADRGMSPATDISRRRRDVRIMVAPRTPPSIRRALLAHHGLRRVVYRKRDALRYRWAAREAAQIHGGADLRIAVLRDGPSKRARP